jgi:hypothetical protein
MFAATPQVAYAQTANDVLVTLAASVQTNDFAAARAAIQALQAQGIGAITVGTEVVTLEALLAMIAAAEAGQMDPLLLAAYLEALSESTATALFTPVEGTAVTTTELPSAFPTGSEG